MIHKLLQSWINLITFVYGLQMIIFLSPYSRSQDLASLSDRDLASFVFLDLTNTSDAEIALWSSNGKPRIELALLPPLPRNFGNSGDAIEFDRWCVSGLQDSMLTTDKLEASLLQLCPNSSKLVLRNASKSICKSLFDLGETADTRAVAKFILITNDMVDLRDSICLLAILLTLKDCTEASGDLQNLLAYLELVDECTVMSRFISLYIELKECPDFPSTRVLTCLSNLKKGVFYPPFELVAGNTAISRRLVAAIEQEGEEIDSPVLCEIVTSEFEILEDFRTDKKSSLARSARAKFFDLLLRSLKNRLSGLPVEERMTFFNAIKWI